MTHVVVAEPAVAELHDLVRSRRLPADTVDRLRRSLKPLEDFPELGAELGGALAARRFLLGPWRWMILVYRHSPERDLVAVLAIVDGRTSTSPLADR